MQEDVKAGKICELRNAKYITTYNILSILQIFSTNIILLSILQIFSTNII